MKLNKGDEDCGKYLKKGRYVVMNNMCCGCRFIVRLTFVRYKLETDPIMKWELLFRQGHPDCFSEHVDEDSEGCIGCTGTGRRGMKDTYIEGVYDEFPMSI